MPACKLWLTKREIIKRCGISSPRLAEVLAKLASAKKRSLRVRAGQEGSGGGH